MAATQTRPAQRLAGLDLARYLAFVGMVIVNFKIAMGAEGGTGLLSWLTGLLEGRAAATFVVLAGVGLGLSAQHEVFSQTFGVTLKRAVFLLALGLANMLIFDADILHYYAFYFLFAALLLPLTRRALAGVIVALNIAAVVMILTLNYDVGWDWEAYSYADFWTPQGFVRNLVFNGWHPIVPWLGFMLFGIILSRQALGEGAIQRRLLLGGGLAMAAAWGLSMVLTPIATAIDPELAALVTTSPVPPMPLYTLAGSGAASLTIGACLLLSDAAARWGVLRVITPAGRQTLTLYIAQILLGMGTLEALGRLGGQSVGQAVTAALLFCALATGYAWLWSRRFKRGPIEAVMRALAG
ncbi:DUF418 domain-containing protein [Pararhodobacter sp.]|uniref:DUF418 domain-containing protein n=1 Tax=Pararhodobacter sp. TaxID=2127056 RepID=UPI002AFFC48B|nr:DUF418 domain-containing protein [Pararhodobacter sp.]